MNELIWTLRILSVIFIVVGTLLSLTFIFMPFGIALSWLGALVYLPVYIINLRREVKEKESRSGD